MDFRTTILPHRDRLYRLALSITVDTAEAEDVVQDTMLKAWERRSEWPQIQSMPSWLMQIAKNLALDRRKKMDRMAPLPTSPKGETLVEQTLVVTQSPDEIGDSALIARLIAQLTPPQDDIIRLRDIEGYTYREIADQLNLSEDQVRVYLHRARTKLREQYAAIQGFGLSTSHPLRNK